MPRDSFRTGTVVLAGPPNVGKSSLLNALIGLKVAATAPRPQTTRFLVRGVLDSPRGQIVFVDTAGLLKPANAMERGMHRDALEAAKSADVIVWLASPDVDDPLPPPGLPLKPGRTLMVVNKIDAYSQERLKKLQATLRRRHRGMGGLSISVVKKRGLKELVSTLFELLPEGPPLFDDDQATDQTMRQIAAEMVREKALLFTRDEVPHSLAVSVDAYNERGDGLHDIAATLYVERDSQKAILIGKGGSMLKRIGTAARKEIERAADARVNLKLWVKVSKDWKNRPRFLKALGYPSARQVS